MGVLDSFLNFLNNSFNSAMDGSFEKMAILNALNKSFKEQFKW